MQGLEPSNSLHLKNKASLRTRVIIPTAIILVIDTSPYDCLRDPVTHWLGDI